MSQPVWELFRNKIGKWLRLKILTSKTNIFSQIYETRLNVILVVENYTKDGK